MVKINKHHNLFELVDVTKTYEEKNFLSWFSKKHQSNSKDALCNISLSLNAGEILGLLGPNGAGKSSIVKIICGLQQCTSGSVQVLQFENNFRHRDFLKQIGVVFGHKSALWWDLPVTDSFFILEKIYGIEKHKYRKRLSDLLDAFDLHKVIKQRLRNLSLGERVKCEVVAALAHDPKLIILDEPTIGLDVVSKSKLRDYIKYTVQSTDKIRGALITSHDMLDIEHCAHRVTFLNEGRKIYDGSVASINRDFGKLFTISLIAKEEPFSELFITEILRQVTEITSNKDDCFYKISNPANISWIVNTNVKNIISQHLMEKTKTVNCQINSIPASLEDIYLKKYSKGRYNDKN